MRRGSNRERIARAAAEAEIASTERAAKKAAKGDKSAAPRPKRAPKAPARMKVVWEVCSPAGATIKTFLYPDKAAAEAATEALSKSTGRTHILRAAKVPMD
jgi:hypothetical protein